MERLTKYDTVRNCYVIRPDAKQGEHIQRLGMYEDRDEVKEPYVCGKMFSDYPVYRCPTCKKLVDEDLKFTFCPSCGQRLKEVDE